MSGADASFLYFETPATHMHVLGTLVVDITDNPGWSAEDLIELLQHRLDLLPPFRQKLALAMLRLHHPVWVDVPDVDVREHVNRVSCPAPGTMVELAREVASFASKKLDRSRPLWECLVVEDLADNRAAIVIKVHHCAVDGVGAARILSAIFDLLPEGRTEAELLGAKQEARALQQPEPSVADVAVHTVTGLATRPWHTARVGISAAKALTGIIGRRVGDADTSGGALPLTAPRAPFNGAITPGRTVAYVDVALDDVKAIKSAVGGTFNDAVTAITGGALRSYLLKRDELPDSSLIAVIPVSTRGDETDIAANRTSAMFTSLGTDVADPVERLKVVHQANKVAKGDQQAMGPDLVARVSEAAPPNATAALARLYSMLRFANLHPVVHNLVLSNVAGPPFQIYVAGAKVDGIFPLGPVMEGPGLNITVVSYRDRVGFGIIACSDRLPDIDDLAAEFPAAVEEMLLAVR
ncbi:MAG: diacylglycerol O-acyltransferase / wax synthase [Frankiales bacterium]|jgi:WS/DGAT/MGAT family acyltransferase|nr:diacylglycerol O-acyltransferase / wax synthase [Frankiales bacterium]